MLLSQRPCTMVEEERTVEIVLAAHPIFPSTSCDEAIAMALAEEAAEGAAQAAAGPAERGSPSAPPLPPEVSAGGSGWEGSTPQPTDRRNEQLARDLQQEELRALSGEDRERLTALPGLLGETSLVRSLSQQLASLAGASFSKLVPQTNPSAAEAAAEAAAAAEAPPTGRALLEQRLRLYCLVERTVKGDGACQFRSLSDQLYGTPRLHAFVRDVVCKQLQAQREWYEGFVLPADFRQYCADMARPSTWGDHVTLQAAADAFGLRIWLLTSFEQTSFLEIEPREQRSSRVLLLSFYAEVHYNSLYFASSPPPPLPHEKLLGSRRLYQLVWGSPLR